MSSRKGGGNSVTGELLVEESNAAGLSVVALDGVEKSVVCCTDLSALSKVTGHDCYGFLGMAFLDQFVVQIDFDSGKLRFYSAVPQDAGTPIPMLVSQMRTPAVQAILAGPGTLQLSVGTALLQTLGGTRTIMAASLESGGRGHAVRRVDGMGGRASW